MQTFAGKIIAFNRHLEFKSELPPGIRVMNPFREYPAAVEASEAFYLKYYSDYNPRKLILGINPGRFGAGLTGIPFTDPKRLLEKCNIETSIERTHEPSSEFIYNMIDAYGGPEKFYAEFFIHSVFPLGFCSVGSNGREVNYNYYDSKSLQELVTPYIINSIHRIIALGITGDKCLCLGTGKNYSFLKKLNDQHKFFGEIIPVEHPRFVKQYKSKQEGIYIDKYLRLLNALFGHNL